MDKLQLVQNFAARIVANKRKYEHATPILRSPILSNRRKISILSVTTVTTLVAAPYFKEVGGLFYQKKSAR